MGAGPPLPLLLLQIGVKVCVGGRTCAVARAMFFIWWSKRVEFAHREYFHFLFLSASFE